jgi:hypothetical protein
MQHAVPQRPWPVTTTILLLIAVFILDLFTPAGIVMPLLYTLPLLSALLVPDRRFFLSVTGAAMMLTPLGFYFSPPGGVVWMGLVNRSMALIALAVTAAFYWLHQQAKARLKSLQELLPLCSGCQQVRDDKGYWKQLELYLEEHQGTQFSRGLCPACARKEMEALPA